MLNGHKKKFSLTALNMGNKLYFFFDKGELTLQILRKAVDRVLSDEIIFFKQFQNREVKVFQQNHLYK